MIIMNTRPLEKSEQMNLRCSPAQKNAYRNAVRLAGVGFVLGTIWEVIALIADGKTVKVVTDERGDNNG